MRGKKSGTKPPRPGTRGSSREAGPSHAATTPELELSKASLRKARTQRAEMAGPMSGASARQKQASQGSAEQPAEAASVPFERTPSKPFPVVGVGASAGGLEAFTTFLRALPSDTGMAFVLVQHMDPSHVSLLNQLLGRDTNMPVL
jgi:chemotaxis response regulator CheB